MAYKVEERSMNVQKLKWRIQYYAQYFPFTIHSILFAIATYISIKWLYQPLPKGEISNGTMPLILLLGKLIFWSLLALMGSSLITTIFCWIYFKWLMRSQRAGLTVQFNSTTYKDKASNIQVEATLNGSLKPLLGFVMGRIVYDKQHISESFCLLSSQAWWTNPKKKGLSGKNSFTLYDIKEYEVNGGFVYFQDLFHLCSLAIRQPIQGHFNQAPLLVGQYHPEVAPKKTETLDIRIDQLRKVEGDLFNYKDFEAGDDVRRIVWKVFAKNRSLVVRIPERLEPYASHLYFYASFYSAKNSNWLNEAFLQAMLNKYKNSIWSVLSALNKQEWAIRYIPDQEIALSELATDAQQHAKFISSSLWQQDTTLLEYFNPKQGSVLCISSLSDVKSLSEVLSKCDRSTLVYYIKLSHTFKQNAVLNLLSRILLSPPANPISRLKNQWLVHPMRLELERNEQQISALLRKSDVQWSEL